MLQHLFLLLFGNLVIGVIEGAVIARVFKTELGRTILLAIPANYLSMWAGILLFGLGEMPSPIPDNIFDEPLYRVGALRWICVGVALALSIILEWPFYLLAVGKRPHWLKRSILATLLAQLSSYTCLFMPYCMSGRDTLNREVTVVRSLTADSGLLRGTVYFINPADGDVHRIRLDGRMRQHEFDADLTGQNDVLAAVRDPDEFGQPWTLRADSPRSERVFLDNIRGQVDSFRASFGVDSGSRTRTHGGWWLGVSGVSDLRARDDRTWIAEPRGNYGVTVRNEQTGEQFNITYDTTFASWWGRCVTMLPGNLVVFELGSQVCLLDIDKREITLLARGRGPVVILDGPVTEQSVD
jgi:hypothetical protein